MQLSYSKLEPGGFMMKGADRKMWFDQRQARIAAAAGEPDDGDKEEMEQERLERKANELTSQLKKAERVEAQAREKDQQDKAKMIQPTYNRWTLFEATESCNVSGSQKEKEVDEDGRYCEQ